MMTNLLFSQASALGKRLAMVLTMLLIVGIGQAWGETVADEITFGNPGDKNNYEAIKLTKEGTFTDHNNFIWSCSSDAAISNGGGALSACYSYAGNKNTSSSYIEISWTADKDYNVTQFDLNAYANGDNPQIILTIDEQVSTITAPKSKGTTFYSFSTNNFLVQLQKGKKITARIQKDASKAVTGIVALKYTFVECTAETSVTLDLNGGTFTSTSDDWTPEGENYKKEGVTGAITLPTPTKTGYNFDGWYDGETKVNSPYTPSETVTLVAKWTPITYTVIFDKNNASATGTMSNQIFDYGTAQTLTKNTFTLTGYTFSGWNTKGDGSGTSYSDKKSVNNLTTTNNATITLYAQWEINTYKVTFNANGGTGSMSTQTFKHGQEQTLDANTFTRDHYTFNGWKDGSDNTYTDKQSITLTADLNLYAQWTANTYTIKFDAGTGTCTSESVTTTNASGVTLPTASPSNACTEEGWIFAGWAKTSIIEETTTSPDPLYVAGSTYNPVENIILYAVYVKQTFTLSLVDNSITYYVGGYESSKSILTAETEKNNAMVFRIVDGQYLRCESGYISHNSTNSTNVSCYADKNNVFPWTITENTGNITFQSTKAEGNVRYLGYNYNDGNPRFAVYVESYAHNFTKTTTTTYNSNPECTPPCAMVTITNATPSIGGFSLSINKEAVTSPIENCGQGNLTITIVPYAGYRIKDVSNTTGLSIDAYGTATATYTKNTTIDSEVTLEPLEYTITLHTNGGTINSGNVSSYKCGEGAILPTDVTKDGYTFGGWYDLETFYGSAVTTIGTTETDSKEFWAKWTPAVYSITYKDQGDGAFSGQHEAGYPENHTYNTATTLKSASKDHYTFSGWYKESDCSGDAVTTLGATEYTDNITLYAKWTANQYTVTFNTNGHGTAPATQTVEYGSKATKPTNPTAAGYEFSGWYKDAGCTEKYDFNTLVTGNVTLYAKWLKIVNVKWVVNGQSIGSSTSSEGASFTPPVVNTIPCGAVLAGWTDAENGVYEHGTSTLYEGAQPSIPITDDKTFYAVFADLEGAVPEMPTVIAYWSAKEITTSEMNADEGIGSMKSNIALSTKSSTGKSYYRNLGQNGTTQPVITLSNLNLTTSSNVCFSFWARGSAQGNLTVKTNLSDEAIATFKLTTKEALYVLENIPTTATSIVITYEVMTGTFFFGTVKFYEAPEIYSFEKLTAENTNGWTGSDWDGYYLITNAGTKALDGNAIGESSIQTVVDVDNKIECSITTAFHIIYNSEKNGYSVQGVGDGDYLQQGNKTITVSSTASYIPEISYNSLNGTDNYALQWNGDKCAFYASEQSAPQMYKIMSELSNPRTLCTYEITYEETYGVVHSNPVTYTAANLPLTFTAPTSAREGYAFKGWSPASLDENTRGDQVVEAQWAANTYSVIFNANSGTGTMENQQFTYDVEQALSANQFTRVGYTFAGWNDNASGNSTSYTDQQVVKNLSSAKNGQRTLYAQWTANTNTSYVVKHYKEQLDGTYPAEADDTDNYTGTTASSVTPEVKSYEGFTAPSTQTVSIAADGSTVVTYQYTRNSYNLSWDVNSGDALTGEYTSGSVKYGASITQPNTPTRIGYTFANWSPEVPATMPAGDATYTAQWQLIQYTITWSVGGSTTTSIVSVETPLSLPTSPANDALGCCADAFIGWSVYAQPTKDQVFNDVANAPEIDENKTFYAVFATTTLTEGSATATFNEMGYTNAEKVTEIALGDGEGHGDATILFAKEQSAPNYPAYYTASGALHAYAKNTITINSTSATSTITNVQFTFAAKEDGSNTISANVGTYADGTWSGTAESVVFTIGGETGHRKITSITVTTQAVEQYTNYVTKCTYGNSPTLGAATVTYNSGDGIDVRCEQTSTMNKAATLTFPNAADLTCPITLTASAGFLISTSKSNDAGYQTSLTVSPYKSGSAQAGKLRTIYVRANAIGKTENYSGTITISGGEVAEQTITVNANVNCQGYTLTLKDHLGNTIGTPTSHYEGDIIELPTELEEDACSENYTFDGWSTAPVEYGSLIYNKVSFLYTMPAEDVTLYPVYQCNKTADYHRVTSDLGANNWAGDYLIAASSQIVADGSTSNLGTINGDRIDENIVPASFGNLYYVSLIAVEGGYVLKTQESANNTKPYVYIQNTESAATSQTATESTAANYPLDVQFNSVSDIRIYNPLSLSGKAISYYWSSKSFGFYKQTAIYLYKKSPLYTTSLICGTIEIQENDIVVTSTKDQSIKVSVPVKLTSSYNDAVAITGANVNAFSVITKENVPVNTEEVVNVELVYSPQAYDQLDIETITLTATNGATTSFQVTGRSLPETFAIVAKVGNVWYALPSQGLNSETTPVGYPVKVDNNDNPTAVTSLPITAEWSLRNVYKVNGQNDRFTANGENLVFVNTENKTLYANNGNANIQTYAEYTNYATTNPERYEWVPTTTDLTNYTLKNVGRDKDLSINVNATFGTHASNIASNNLRFLPINATYNPFDMQVVEWYPTKVLVQTEAVLTSVSAIVGGIAVANPVVTKKGGKLYEISGLPLESNPTKILTISYDTYSCSKVIPIIISRATKSVTDAPFTTLTTSVYNYSDLVVRDGATLTINGTKQAPDKFVNVTIYPTAKIVVPENKQLSVYSLTFFGGISEIYNGSTYDINKYGVPQLSLKGTLGKTVTTMDYIMRVDLEQMYQVGVPYDVNLNEITYWDGASIALGTALYVSAYDGAARARLDWDNTWQWEVNFAEKVLKAGIGYTISAEPQVAGDTYSILRMPMKNNINSGNTETQKATINVTAHGMSDENLTDNHKGWNYLSNPYMTSISGAESGGVDNNNIVVGYLVETGKGPWEWKNDTYRYVTIPYDDGTNYYQRKFSEATLLPFKSFFLQIANSGDLSFALASRLNAPMRHLQQQENAPREVEFELLLSNDAQSDNTGLLISEEFTPAYEINADLEKMTGTMSVYTIYNGYQLAYNALSPLNAMEEIPLGYVVPTTGEYTFNLDERGDLDDIEHIYLLDHDSSITTDLMEDIYTFTATEKKNDHRFAISVILKAEEEEETPTHLETLEWESDHPYKFIYQDKMYILRNGVIYDAMGKQVQTINK